MTLTMNQERELADNASDEKSIISATKKIVQDRILNTCHSSVCDTIKDVLNNRWYSLGKMDVVCCGVFTPDYESDIVQYDYLVTDVAEAVAEVAMKYEIKKIFFVAFPPFRAVMAIVKEKPVQKKTTKNKKECTNDKNSI